MAGDFHTAADVSPFKAIWERQALLYANVPRCPACADDQIQCLSDEIPAKWKCRICKHKFDYEPRSQ